MRLNRTVKGLLRQAGAKLKRSKKHLVFGLPDGKNVVLSHTPSDGNAVHQQIRYIKQHLEIPKKEPKAPAPRRAKPGRQGEPRHQQAPPPNNAMADQLRTLGVAEAALRAEINELLRINSQITTVNASLKLLRARCFWCRFTDWYYERHLWKVKIWK